MEKILIIDDFEPFRSTACRVVERLGFQSLSASDGREGLDIFARERPGIVITDLQMPQVDGTGVLLAIKEKSPQTAVVVLTGFSTEAAEQDLLRLGAFACLKKPLNLQQVVQVITQIQEKRRGLSNDVRPRALLKVDSPASRHVLERALHANGCDTQAPETTEEWRVSLERGDLDLLVWEVHAHDRESLRHVMETRPLRAGFEVILLMTESGPAETVAREILQSAPTECLSAPLDDALVAASFQRAFHRLLVRRNALFKRERLNAGSARVGVGDQGELVVDMRGGDPHFLESLESVSARLPWPWMLLGSSWEVVYASPSLEAWVGKSLPRLDKALWACLEGRGLVLPPIEEVYLALAQCVRGETLPGLSRPEAVGMIPVRILPNKQGSDRFVALFFPSSSPQEKRPSFPKLL
ncbi:MAG: response regulator [Elusimicrobia bacterium]|jgi:DNA-binding response OmpR family regulator|nr:response regulator [Elusimicrobiota bacterium]